MTLTQIGFALLIILLIFTTSVMVTITIYTTNKQTNTRITNLQAEIIALRSEVTTLGSELKAYATRPEWWEAENDN